MKRGKDRPRKAIPANDPMPPIKKEPLEPSGDFAKELKRGRGRPRELRRTNRLKKLQSAPRTEDIRGDDRPEEVKSGKEHGCDADQGRPESASGIGRFLIEIGPLDQIRRFQSSFLGARCAESSFSMTTIAFKAVFFLFRKGNWYCLKHLNGDKSFA